MGAPTSLHDVKRRLYDLDTAALLGLVKASVSTVGLQSVAVATKTGDGDMTSTKTGAPKRTGDVEVEIVSGGELGASTFKWRCSRIAANAWQVNGGPGFVTAASVSLTTDAAVDIGVTVQFTAGGPGDDHDAGDRWTFTVTHEATTTASAVAVTFDLITEDGETDAIVLNHASLTSGSHVQVDRICQKGTATQGYGEIGNSADGIVKAAGKVTLLISNSDGGGDEFDGTFVASVILVP